MYLLVTCHSYGKLPFIVDLPIKKTVVFYIYSQDGIPYPPNSMLLVDKGGDAVHDGMLRLHRAMLQQ